MKKSLLFSLCFVVSSVVCKSAFAEKPNVVILLSDDQGWGDFSLHGNKDIATPHIDSLARDGVQFDRFFVCPVCSPTRAEFLTGRYHVRGGVYSTSAGGERLDLDEKTIADTFRAAGYATGAFGKWHNGMQYPYHPNGRGFDEFYGFCSGHWGNYFSPPLDHNGKVVRGEGFVIDDFTNKAMKFIEKNREKPFFVFLPYCTPHSPMQVPERFWKKFEKRELQMPVRSKRRVNRSHRRAALAMCENIDWNVGRLLEKLDELDLSEKTIVGYFNDNGPNGERWNGGMKGRKGSTDEGGVRSPLLLRWPGTIPAGRVVKTNGAAIDLLPTLADLAGIDVVSTKALDGISLEKAILGGEIENPNRPIISHWRSRISVRSGPYRLDQRGALFDLTKDPGQHVDISKEHPAVTKRLRATLEEWRKTVLPELGKDERPFVIGHPGHRYTQIPARDVKASGQIKRSNKFPNCSYFTNWTRVEDTISLDVEVAAKGRFEVELHYACPKGDEGALIELGIGGSKLRAKIAEPHDVPPRGAEHDRVKRMESYVKDFRPLQLGVIELEAGRAKCTLRAIENAKGQVMEFRLLVLKRVE